MAKTKKTKTKTKSDTDKMLDTLPDLDERLPADLRSAALRSAINEAKTKAKRRNVAFVAWRTGVDEAKAADKAVKGLMVRIRSAVKGIYGPDSVEYQSVGGKRASERKRPVRRQPK